MASGVDLSEVRQLEEQLLKPEIRHSPDALDALIADDFYEIGGAGNTYDKSRVMSLLLNESPAVRTIVEWSVRSLAPDVALANYRVDASGAESWRTSIWVRRDERWQITFHQGTPATSTR